MAPDFTDSDREPDETDGSNEMSGASQDGPSGPVDGALDVVDRSIGMYVLRRLTGRSSSTRRRRRMRPWCSPPTRSRSGSVSRRCAGRTARAVRGAASRCRGSGYHRRGAGDGCPEDSAAIAGECRRGRTRTRSPDTWPQRPRSAPARLLHRANDSSATPASRSSPLPSSALPSSCGRRAVQTGEPTGSVFVVDRAVVTPDPSDDGGDAHGHGGAHRRGCRGDRCARSSTPEATPPRRTRPSHRRS